MGTRLDGVKTLITGAKPRVSSEDWKSRRTKAEKELVNHYEGIIEDIEKHNKSILQAAEKETGMYRSLVASVRTLEEEGGYQVMKEPDLDLTGFTGSPSSIIKTWVLGKAEETYGKRFFSKQLLNELNSFLSKPETTKEIDGIISELINKHANKDKLMGILDSVLNQNGSIKKSDLGDIKKQWSSP